MRTEILKIQPDNIDMRLIKKAADVILAGGLVAFPTETVYGLGANALIASAVRSIFRAKGRPADNPLIAHVSSASQVERVVLRVPENARRLMDAFWPGPLTLVMNKACGVAPEVTAGLETIAVRMPSHPVALALIETAGVPVAAPSANLSGKPSPTTAAHVIEDLSGKIDIIIDSGKCSVGLESTVLDVTGEVPLILRPGAVTKEQIAGLTGSVGTASSFDGEAPRSPGMKYSHYTPNAQVIVVSGPLGKVVDRISRLADQYEKEGKRVGILATAQTAPLYNDAMVINIGDRANLETIAYNLLEALRELDALKADIVLAESVETQGLGHAIMNRLYKAAGYNIIKA